MPLHFSHFKPGKLGQVLEGVNPPIQYELIPLGTQSAEKKNNQTTPCKSNLSSLLGAYRGSRGAVLMGHSAISLWTEGQEQPGPCTRPGSKALFQTALSPQFLLSAFTDLSSSFQWLCDNFLCLMQFTVQKINLHLEALM